MSIKYHFFGKDCSIDRELSNRSNLKQSLEGRKFPNRHILFVNQVHGRDVMAVPSAEQIYGEQNLPKVDAIITTLPNVVIAIVTADCAPILLFDEEKKVIAAAHAGWRGAKVGIIESVINKMKDLGARNITAIIGPMIQQESYEVSSEFKNDFLAENKGNESFFSSGVSAEKYLFDLNYYVENKLRKAGVLEIQNSKIDTYNNEKEFFSFRRSTHHQEKDCGRNISVIGIVG